MKMGMEKVSALCPALVLLSIPDNSDLMPQHRDCETRAYPEKRLSWLSNFKLTQEEDKRNDVISLEYSSMPAKQNTNLCSTASRVKASFSSAFGRTNILSFIK